MEQSISNLSMDTDNLVLPLELIYLIFKHLDLQNIANFALVSHDASAAVSAYIKNLVNNELRMRNELILQKQKTIQATKQYIKILNTYKKFSPLQSMGIVTFFIAMFLYFYRASPEFDNLTQFKLFLFFVVIGTLLAGACHYLQPAGYNFNEKIAMLNNKHKQQYLQLPGDTREKMLIKFSRPFFSMQPGNADFGRYIPIHRLVSMLQEVIGDLKAEVKTVQKYPKHFRFLDSKKKGTEQDHTVSSKILSHEPIYPVNMMRKFKRFFIARQQRNKKFKLAEDLIYQAMTDVARNPS